MTDPAVKGVSEGLFRLLVEGDKRRGIPPTKPLKAHMKPEAKEKRAICKTCNGTGFQP